MIGGIVGNLFGSANFDDGSVAVVRAVGAHRLALSSWPMLAFAATGAPSCGPSGSRCSSSSCSAPRVQPWYLLWSLLILVAAGLSANETRAAVILSTAFTVYSVAQLGLDPRDPVEVRPQPRARRRALPPHRRRAARRLDAGPRPPARRDRARPAARAEPGLSPAATVSRRDLTAAGILDPRPARVLRALPRAQRPARQDLLPRDAAAPAREAARTSTRSTASPATPTRSSTTSAATTPPAADASSSAGATRSSPTYAAGAATTRSCRAVVDTVQRWDIPVEHFEAFLRVDGDGPHRHRLRDLRRPLRPTSTAPPPSSACRWCRSSNRWTPGPTTRAKDLGVAFQLANFVRDVGEDLDRGRVYLPARGPGPLRPHPRRPRASGRRRPGQGPAALPDRPGPAPRGGRPPGHRPARPDEPPVHRGRAHPLLRHRRRGRGHRLPGVHPARDRPAPPPARRRRPRLGQGRAAPAGPPDR